MAVQQCARYRSFGMLPGKRLDSSFGLAHFSKMGRYRKIGHARFGGTTKLECLHHIQMAAAICHRGAEARRGTKQPEAQRRPRGDQIK